MLKVEEKDGHKKGEKMKSSISKKKDMISDIVRYYLKKKQRPIHIWNTQVTLQELARSKKSISRFGDGEFNLIFGNNIPFQKVTPELSKALKMILQEDENNKCLVGIPYAMQSLSGLTAKSKFFWMRYLAKNFDSIYSQLNINYHYYDSQVSRIYVNRANKNASATYFSAWKNIWRDQRILLVEGEYSRFGVGNDLLNGASKVDRMLCPSVNAFSSYKKIYSAIVNVASKYDLIILVLGPTASVLSFELSKLGIWALDCGNMDMEYEWMTMGAHTQVAVSNKYTIEAKSGTKVGRLEDKQYLDQIVAKIDL